MFFQVLLLFPQSIFIEKKFFFVLSSYCFSFFLMDSGNDFIFKRFIFQSLLSVTFHSLLKLFGFSLWFFFSNRELSLSKLLHRVLYWMLERNVFLVKNYVVENFMWYQTVIFNLNVDWIKSKRKLLTKHVEDYRWLEFFVELC